MRSSQQPAMMCTRSSMDCPSSGTLASSMLCFEGCLTFCEVNVLGTATPATAAVAQEGLAHLCLVGSSTTLVRAKVEANLPRKRGPAVAGYDKAWEKFMDQVTRNMQRAGLGTPKLACKGQSLGNPASVRLPCLQRCLFSHLSGRAQLAQPHCWLVL